MQSGKMGGLLQSDKLYSSLIQLIAINNTGQYFTRGKCSKWNNNYN